MTLTVPHFFQTIFTPSLVTVLQIGINKKCEDKSFTHG